MKIRKKQSVDEQALQWVVRLRSDQVSEQDLDSFAEWVTAGKTQRAAWNEALQTWETLGVVERLPLDGLLRSRESAKVLDFPVSRPQSSPRGRRYFGAAATVVVACVLAWVLWPVTPASSVFKTATGESRAIELRDGSVVELNTQSEIRVSLLPDERRVELVRGEAFFKVAPDKQRPFRVKAGKAQAEAVGTAFNVYRDSRDSARIVVVEGVVRVSEIEGSATRSADNQLLIANQEVMYRPELGIGKPANANVERITAWRHGQLVFENATLGEAVTAINRYLEHKITIADGASSGRRLSGVFSIRQPDETIRAVGQALDLSVTHQANGWLLSRSDP